MEFITKNGPEINNIDDFTFWEEQIYAMPRVWGKSFIDFIICYMIPVFILWSIIPLCKKEQQFKSLDKYLYKIKFNEIIFKTLLASQETLILNDLAKCITSGDPSATLIVTVVLNPYCVFCAEMHDRVIKLLNKYSKELRLEYVFIGEENMEKVIKKLIAIYLLEKLNFPNVYTEWFQRRDEKIFEKYKIDEICDNAAQMIYIAQHKWKEDRKVIVTPTVYVNGHELPIEYEIEDICIII